jgi:hypothetical protein
MFHNGVLYSDQVIREFSELVNQIAPNLAEPRNAARKVRRDFDKWLWEASREVDGVQLNLFDAPLGAGTPAALVPRLVEPPQYRPAG